MKTIGRFSTEVSRQLSQPVILNCADSNARRKQARLERRQRAGLHDSCQVLH